MIERLYEEVLEEGAIMDWFKDPENRPTLKQLATQLTVMFGWPISAFTMGHYVSDFLEKNFPNLPEQAVSKIAQFIADNPQILDLIKS
jgi:hypothetical protein